MLSDQLARGCAYVAAYLGWARVFYRRVDPWARRLVGRRLGVEVIWVPVTTFPVEVSCWGPAAPCGGAVEAGLGLGAAAMCFAGALAPVLALCAVLRWTTWLSPHTSDALYLATTPLMLTFVATQTRRKPPGQLAPEQTQSHQHHSHVPGRGLP